MKIIETKNSKQMNRLEEMILSSFVHFFFYIFLSSSYYSFFLLLNSYDTAHIQRQLLLAIAEFGFSVVFIAFYAVRLPQRSCLCVFCGKYPNNLSFRLFH